MHEINLHVNVHFYLFSFFAFSVSFNDIIFVVNTCTIIAESVYIVSLYKVVNWLIL